jgi:glycerol-3-phosphate dehydrogenase (NAD(P)+)
MEDIFKIAVLGAGSFGTAMAHALYDAGRDVVLWARDAKLADEIARTRRNAKYLDDTDLGLLPVTSDLERAVAGRDMLVFAVPCQHVRGFLAQVAPFVAPGMILVNLAKGVEIGTLKTPSQVFKDVFGESSDRRFAAVSGPTFAIELARRMPTGAAVASLDGGTAETVQRALSTPRFRLYRLTDLTGVELGGALKNVMAIAVGIAEGLGFGHNTRAGLMTRCLHEMTEMGLSLGANARTFSGLSGIGDLILTCTGDLSRNRQVGLRIGRGEKVGGVLASLPHVAEGVPTAKSVYDLSRKLGLDMPNTRQVFRILYEGLPPREAVEELLARGLKAEYEA